MTKIGLANSTFCGVHPYPRPQGSHCGTDCDGGYPPRGNRVLRGGVPPSASCNCGGLQKEMLPRAERVNINCGEEGSLPPRPDTSKRFCCCGRGYPPGLECSNCCCCREGYLAPARLFDLSIRFLVKHNKHTASAPHKPPSQSPDQDASSQHLAPHKPRTKRCSTHSEFE